MLNETAEALDGAIKAHFATADYVIFVLMIVVSILIGIYVGFRGLRNDSTKEYLIGGRKMHPIPVALSLTGGITSALSVLGKSTEVYMYGTQILLVILGGVWGTIFIVYVILPTLYPLDLVSMMQYLNMRFNSPLLQKMCSLAQIFTIIIWMGMVLYTPSIALASVTAISKERAIIILGLVCVTYITMGGVKAVVYTDVVQTVVMFLGLIAVITIACIDVGGVSEVFRIANEGQRIEFFNLDFDPTTRTTFWNTQILGWAFIVGAIAISQPQYQRLTSVGTLKEAQGLCFIFLVLMAILWGIFAFSGLIAYAAYFDCDPLKSGQIEKPDQIIPFMVGEKLSHLPGLSGLFVSAVYASVLSTVSSIANAISALAWEDFISDWQWVQKRKIRPVTVTRILSAVSGFIGIGVAFLVGEFGNIFQTAVSIFGAIASPIDGLFVVAIIAPWVHGTGALIGLLTSLAFNLWMVGGKFYYKGGNNDPLPFRTDGCSNDILNQTTTTTTTTPSSIDLYGSTLSSDLVYNVELQNEKSHLSLYDTSHCLYGFTGINVCILVSCIISAVWNPIGAYDIDEKLVNSTCLKYYRKFWDRFVSGTNQTTFNNKSKQMTNGVDNEGIELEPNEQKTRYL